MPVRASTATTCRPGGHAVQAPVVVICFGPAAEPLPLIDQERELLIQAEGLLMQAQMLAWERTGDFGAHGAATRHQTRMMELIKGRSQEMRTRMAAERGLPQEGCCDA